VVQAVVQVPQWAGSLRRSTQTPPHSRLPAGHWHLPVAQNEPPVHLIPQPPQLRSSEAVLVQEPLHEVRPVEHMAWQVPIWQVWAAAQACPQLPQWAALVATSTQVPPQSVVPVGQPQVPI